MFLCVKFSWLQNYFNSEIFLIYSIYISAYTYMHTYIDKHLSIYLSIYLYIYLSSYLSIYLPTYLHQRIYAQVVHIHINVHIDHNFPTIRHSIVPQHFCYSFSGTTYFQSHCYTQSNRRMDVDMSTYQRSPA